MQQIKIFKGIESDLSDLEGRVNTWINQNSARVVNVFGNIAPQSGAPAAGSDISLGKSFAPSDILIIVTYEKA